jgi:flagellar FliL protein
MADNEVSAEEPKPAVEKGTGLLGLVVAMLITTVTSGVGGGLFGLYANGTSNRLPEPSKKAQKHADDAKRPFAGDVNLRPLASIITNLGGPKGTWIRLEAAIVFGLDAAKEESLLSGRITEDIVGFLRTVPLAQLEGANGFQNLREDLNDRARIRSEGKVREVIIQSLIVE